MKFYTFFFAASVLLISGCSDTSVTEVHLTNEDQPKIINEEPPELVQVLDDLVMEISYGQSRGIPVDTNKVWEASRIAIELSKYDGPMSEAFELLEAQMRGESIKDLEEISTENCRLTSSFVGKMAPCKKNCSADYQTELRDRRADVFIRNAYCLSIAAVGTATSGGVLGLPAAGVAGTCLTWSIMTYWNDIRRADRDYGRCLERC